MKLMFVGDISLGEHYFSFGHGPRTHLEQDDLFNSVANLLSQADLTIGNLEGPISDVDYNKNDPESRVFRGAPSSAAKLKDAGFNVLSLANNHSIQHGEACFNDSVALLEKQCLGVIGLNNQAPKIIKHDDVTIALLACSDVPDNTNTQQTLYEQYDFDNVVAKVNRVKADVDWIILYLHWGLESKVNATSEQKLLAKKLHDAGVDIIIGHHPHIFYEIEQNIKKLTVYSLGNFVFDLPWDDKLLNTGILEINLSKTQINTQVHKVKINNKHKPILLNEASIKINQGIKQVFTNQKNIIPTQFKKLMYFLMYFMRGSTKVKLTFFSKKIIKKLKGI